MSHAYFISQNFSRKNGTTKNQILHIKQTFYNINNIAIKYSTYILSCVGMNLSSFKHTLFVPLKNSKFLSDKRLIEFLGFGLAMHAFKNK